jgi:hypothetical protein
LRNVFTDGIDIRESYSHQQRQTSYNQKSLPVLGFATLHPTYKIATRL